MRTTARTTRTSRNFPETERPRLPISAPQPNPSNVQFVCWLGSGSSSSLPLTDRSTSRIRSGRLTQQQKDYGRSIARFGDNFLVARQTGTEETAYHGLGESRRSAPDVETRPRTEEVTFEFDRVCDGKTDLREFYEDSVKSYFRLALFGTSAAILSFGSARDTRRELLVGRGELKKGLLQLGVEEMIRESAEVEGDTQWEICFAASLIYCGKVVDLLRSLWDDSQYTKVAISEKADFVEIVVKDEYDLKKLLKVVLKEMQRAEPELGATTPLEDSAHVIHSVKVYRRTPEGLAAVSQIDVVRLCGSEQAGNGRSSPGESVKQFATASFNALSNELLTSALCRSGYRRRQSYSPLTQAMSKTLSPYARILFLVCVDDRAESVDQSLPALKFANRIRECICKKLGQAGQLERQEPGEKADQPSITSRAEQLRSTVEEEEESAASEVEFSHRPRAVKSDGKSEPELEETLRVEPPPPRPRTRTTARGVLSETSERANVWLNRKEGEIDDLMNRIKLCLSEHNEEMNVMLEQKHAELLEAKKDLHRARNVVSLDTQRGRVASMVAAEKENVGRKLGTKLERLQCSLEHNDKGVAAVAERLDSIERLILREAEQKKLIETKDGEIATLTAQIQDQKARQAVVDSELESKTLRMRQMEEEAAREKVDAEARLAQLLADSRAADEEHKAKLSRLEREIMSLQDQTKVQEAKHRERLEQMQEQLVNQQRKAEDDLAGEKAASEAEMQGALAKRDKEFGEKTRQLTGEYEGKLARMHDELMKHKELLDQEKEATEGLHNELQACRQELDSVRAAREQDRSENLHVIAAEKEKVAATETQLARKAEELKSVANENRELNVTVVQCKERAEAMQKEAQQLKDGRVELEKQLALSTTTVENLKKDDGRTQERVRRLQDELEDKVKQMSTIQKEFNETVQAKEQQSVEMQGIIEEKQNYAKGERERYDKMCEESAKLRTDNVYLMNKTSQQKDEIEQLRSQLESRGAGDEKELAMMESKYEALSTEMKRLLSGAAEQTEKERRYKRQLEEMEQKALAATERCEKMQQKRKKCKLRLEEAERRIKELEFELALEVKTASRRPPPQQIAFQERYNHV